MRIEDSVWQGSFGYWQNLFIHQNILSIGYTAWNGFLNLGRGIVICKINTPIDCSINWSVDNVHYDLKFISLSNTNAYLQQLKIEKTTISSLSHIVATYEPDRAIVFLSIADDRIDINLLQNMAISPVLCYEQVCQRWEEFQPAPKS